LTLPLNDDREGRQRLASELYRRFHAMKTYGKEPESLDSIIEVFNTDLASFPAAKILKAMSTHAQRSQEFPTVADIVSLIRRNGKPPLSESAYIAIQKKAGEDRTPDDWQYLRDYEADQRGGWQDEPDQRKQDDLLAENTRLRQEVAQLRVETHRLNNLLQAERLSKGIEKPKLSEEDKVNRTIAIMRADGAAEADIAAFAAQYGLNPDGTAIAA
jgi:hypothetical protein